MSWLRRLVFKEASSKLNWSSQTNKNAPPTFVPELIRSRLWALGDFEAQDKIARYDPLGKFITYGRAERCFDDWFKLVDELGEEVVQEAMRQLKLLQAQKILTQVYAMAMAHGWAWLYTGKNRFIPQSGNGGKIATLAAFTRKQCTVFQYYDENDEEVIQNTRQVGEPKTMKLEIDVGKAGAMMSEVLYLPAADFQLWCPNPIGRGYTGRSELDAAWDMLIYLRYLFHSMTFYDIKIGHGLFTAFMKSGFSDDDIAKWNAAFEDVSIKRAMVIDEGQVSKVEFVGPSGQATDFDNHIDKVIEMIAVATEIPATLLKGVAQGEVTGSETNLKLGEVMERRDQKKIEDNIYNLLERMGFTENYKISWNVKYAQDEEEMAKIEQTVAQAKATKLTYMTIDEVRAEEGLPPLPNGRGAQLAADFNIAVTGLQSPEEEEKTNNKEGTQL